MALNGRRLAGLAALGLAFLAGCQHSANRPSGLLSGADNEPAVHLKPNQVADVQVALGRTLEQRGEQGPAAQAYAEALKNDPNRADACVRLAIVSAQQGKVDESNDLYARAIKLQPDNPDTYCNLGYTLYLQHRFTEAEQALRKCLELKPDHQRAHNNLGLVLARSESPAEAVQEFRQAGCCDADARANLAYALSLNGQLKEARQGYEEVLALQPNNDAARRGLTELTALAAKSADAVAAQPAGGPPPVKPAAGSEMPWVSAQQPAP